MLLIDPRRPLERAHVLVLGPGLGAERVALALLDRLPLLGDHPERVVPVLRDAAVDEPAAHDEPRAADAPAAVHGGDAPPALVVAQDGHDAADEVDRVGEGAVADGEVVVLDLAGVDADERAALGEVWRVWEELVGLGEVDECADAGEEERVELLLRVPLHLLGRLWAVWEFARDQIGGRPVRVRDGLWSTRAGGLDGGRWRGG